MISFLTSFTVFIIIITLFILYKKYEDKIKSGVDIKTETLKKYLLEENENVLTSKKPILWIHLDYDYNSRNWKSFGSRSSYDLNQNYLYFTIKSIIMNCDNSFTVVIIDDTTFTKLLPSWKIDMSILPDPVKKYTRNLGMAKLLYTYGGIKVPASFLCFRDLIDLWDKCNETKKMFVCENVNYTNTNMNELFHPDFGFFGSYKKNPQLLDIIQFIEYKISTDNTHTQIFLDEMSKKLLHDYQKEKIQLISASLMGIKDTDEEPILVDHLMNEDYIKIYPNAYGIWVPEQQLINRTKYEYYIRLDTKQLLESDCILSKYILLSNTPEGFSKKIVQNKTEKHKDWVNFWRTDLLDKNVPLYGPKPLGVFSKDNGDFFNFGR